MKNKNLFAILFSCLVLISNSSFGQLDLDDSKVLKIGYRLGITRFNPAFYAVNSNTAIAPKGYSDYIIPSNLDIFWGKNSEHVFYDANLGGIVYLLADYTYDLATGHEAPWLYEKLRKSKKNFPALTESARAYDFDIMDMKMGFGGNGIFFGGQLGYTSFGPTSGVGFDKDSIQTYKATSPYLSYGLGVHYNK